MRVNNNLTDIYKKDIPKQLNIFNYYVMRYDAYRVNPLFSYFTVQDIAELNKIARSPYYHGKMTEKYDKIKEIMWRRGFVLIGGGTNRRAFECVYDPRVVAKVATDSVGFTSNLKEYVNQNVLKPFCNKIFEVTPCGTLALIERVVPIKDVFEYTKYCSEIYDILFMKFRNNEIAMDDIGCNAMKNWGYRQGFGPILLDYPTMYVADLKKRSCKALINGKLCNGTLDYDDGFNNIVCTECGTTYKAVTLSKPKGDSIYELLEAVGYHKSTGKGATKKMRFEIISSKTGKVESSGNCDSRSKYVNYSVNGPHVVANERTATKKHKKIGIIITDSKTGEEIGNSHNVKLEDVAVVKPAKKEEPKKVVEQQKPEEPVVEIDTNIKNDFSIDYQEYTSTLLSLNEDVIKAKDNASFKLFEDVERFKEMEKTVESENIDTSNESDEENEVSSINHTEEDIEVTEPTVIDPPKLKFEIEDSKTYKVDLSNVINNADEFINRFNQLNSGINFDVLNDPEYTEMAQVELLKIINNSLIVNNPYISEQEAKRIYDGMCTATAFIEEDCTNVISSDNVNNSSCLLNYVIDLMVGNNENINDNNRLTRFEMFFRLINIVKNTKSFCISIINLWKTLISTMSYDIDYNDDIKVFCIYREIYDKYYEIISRALSDYRLNIVVSGANKYSLTNIISIISVGISELMEIVNDEFGQYIKGDKYITIAISDYDTQITDCSVDNIESCDEEEEPVVVEEEKSNESFRGMSRKQRNKYQKRRKNNRYDY